MRHDGEFGLKQPLVQALKTADEVSPKETLPRRSLRTGDECLIVAGLLLAVGCAPASSDEALGSRQDHAYTKNAYTKNALSEEAFAAAAGADDLDCSGPYAQETAKYIVRCAAKAGQTMTICGQEYEGAVGAAPDYLNGDLDQDQAELMKECLFSLVNTEGVEVEVSVHSPGLEPRSEWEMQQFPFRQLAVWVAHPLAAHGKLFEGCMPSTAAGVGDSRFGHFVDPDLVKWVAYLGPCDDDGAATITSPPVCTGQTADGSFSGCGPMQSDNAITVSRRFGSVSGGGGGGTPAGPSF